MTAAVAFSNNFNGSNVGGIVYRVGEKGWDGKRD
jgi:hypothetical protein